MPFTAVLTIGTIALDTPEVCLAILIDFVSITPKAAAQSNPLRLTLVQLLILSAQYRLNFKIKSSPGAPLTIVPCPELDDIVIGFAADALAGSSAWVVLPSKVSDTLLNIPLINPNASPNTTTAIIRTTIIFIDNCIAPFLSINFTSNSINLIFNYIFDNLVIILFKCFQYFNIKLKISFLNIQFKDEFMQLPFSLNTLSIIVFIFIIIFLLYKNRKKIEFQKIGSIPIISIMRTHLGVKFIDKIGKKYSKFFKILGYIGMIIGYLGMIAMFLLIAMSFIKLFTHPEVPSAVSPVIPGVRIPGAQIFVPFWYGIIALFIVIVIHELGHGLIAKAHGSKILNTGFVLFLILPGAFVEPDEKKLEKRKANIQNSVYAAGPWFNVLLSIIVMIIMIFLITPAHNSLANYEGFAFSNLDNNSPAMNAGLPINATYTEVNNVRVNNVAELSKELNKYSPQDTISLGTKNNRDYSVTLTNHPEDNNSAYIGILNLRNVRGQQPIIKEIFYIIIDILANLFFWIYVLSLGIGAANLLPIGPLDGGRILITLLKSKFKEKKAKMIATKVSTLTILFLIAALIIPIVRAII